MITPADSPSSPSGYAGVTPHGQGPAPYDIQAPMEDLTPAFDAASALTGAGVLYPQGPRQAQTEALLNSAQGFGEFDVTAGFTSGEWPASVEPGG